MSGISQLTLDGGEADPDISLEESEPQTWDDGTTSPTWLCPECGTRLFAEGTCPCGWFDRERWNATLDTEGLR